MSGVTGIELGPNYCVLVRGGRLGSHRTVSAAAAIMPSAWPDDPRALVEQLREARERHGLSRRARVVAWDSEATLARPCRGRVRDGLSAHSRAGARQGRPRAPGRRSQRDSGRRALAEQSRRRHRDRRGHRGHLHARLRVAAWARRSAGARSELLDRYLLVSQIAPQLQHVIDLVRPVNGVTVTSVVACGNLPDLRSLAMLLIEEMDIEVETLDSTELLDRGVTPGTFGDSVASLQLAAAVASSDENRVPVHAHIEATPAVAGSERTVREAWPLQHASAARFRRLRPSPCSRSARRGRSSQVAGSSPARRVFPDGIAVLAEAAPGRPELRAGSHDRPRGSRRARPAADRATRGPTELAAATRRAGTEPSPASLR